MGDKMISSKRIHDMVYPGGPMGGDKISITYSQQQAFEKAMRETREVMYAHLLSGRPLPVKRENWKDRLKLAWAVLRGRITWGDIG